MGFEMGKVGHSAVPRETHGHLHVVKRFFQQHFVVRLYQGGLDSREEREHRNPKATWGYSWSKKIGRSLKTRGKVWCLRSELWDLGKGTEIRL